MNIDFLSYLNDEHVLEAYELYLIHPYVQPKNILIKLVNLFN